MLKAPNHLLQDHCWRYSIFSFGKNKLHARDQYILTEIDETWCHINKFTGPYLRKTSYKVKLWECYTLPVPNTIPTLYEDVSEPIEDVLTEHLPSPSYEQPPSPPTELTHPYNEILQLS